MCVRACVCACACVRVGGGGGPLKHDSMCLSREQAFRCGSDCSCKSFWVFVLTLLENQMGGVSHVS